MMRWAAASERPVLLAEGAQPAAWAGVAPAAPVRRGQEEPDEAAHHQRDALRLVGLAIEGGPGREVEAEGLGQEAVASAVWEGRETTRRQRLMGGVVDAGSEGHHALILSIALLSARGRRVAGRGGPRR